MSDEVIDTPEARAEAATKVALKNADMIPAKFRREDGTVDVDALTASYLALERKQSGLPAPDPKVEATAQVEPEEPGPSDSLVDAFMDPPAPPTNDLWTKANTELVQTGTISASTTRALLASGVPQEVIANLVTGHKAKAKSDLERAIAIVGGEEQFKQVIAWAKSNLTEEQRRKILSDVSGPNGEMILRGLAASAAAAGAVTPPSTMVDTRSGTTFSPSAGAVRPFESAAEMRAAFNDPKYRTDPEYQKMVARRAILTQGGDPTRVK